MRSLHTLATHDTAGLRTPAPYYLRPDAEIKQQFSVEQYQQYILKMIDQKADLTDVMSGIGQTPLSTAIGFDNKNAALAFIKIDTKKSVINAKSSNRSGAVTPLILAIQKGNQAVAEALIENGADISLQDRYGLTALHWACIMRLNGVIDRLLKSNANSSVLCNQGLLPSDYYQMESKRITENKGIYNQMSDHFIKNVALFDAERALRPIDSGLLGRLSDTVNVNFQTLNGETKSIRITPNSHYRDVKQKIEAEYGEMKCMIFSGHEYLTRLDEPIHEDVLEGEKMQVVFKESLDKKQTGIKTAHPHSQNTQTFFFKTFSRDINIQSHVQSIVVDADKTTYSNLKNLIQKELGTTSDIKLIHLGCDLLKLKGDTIVGNDNLTTSQKDPCHIVIQQSKKT